MTGPLIVPFLAFIIGGMALIIGAFGLARAVRRHDPQGIAFGLLAVSLATAGAMTGLARLIELGAFS
jgi:uncharacterized membrane protein YjfL (UPF0719 family)